jgi:nicotinamidase-related amidase
MELRPPTTDLLIRADHSQLVSVDIQTKLGAAMPAKVLNRVVSNAALLLKSAQFLDIPALVSEQYPSGLGETLPAISEHLPTSVQRFEKTCFSCVGAQDFLPVLRESQRPQVILTGMEAHVCVLQTAMELLGHGFQVYVVEDAICSRKLENYQNALLRMKQCGVMVVSAESVLFEWLRDAKHAHFKAVQALLR